MALVTPAEASVLVSQALETKLNEAIRQAASAGKKSFTFDFSPWQTSDQNQAKKALESTGYTIEKNKDKYASPDSCIVSWS
jgi:hypothetical protein